MITRDEKFPASAAELMAMMNQCSNGYDTSDVLNASLQMLSGSIEYIARRRGWNLAQTLAFAAQTANLLIVSVQDNFEREAQPGDVPVRLT